MQVYLQLDAGPIFMQRSIDINAEDNCQILHDNLSVLGSELLLKVLDDIEIAGGKEAEGVWE